MASNSRCRLVPFPAAVAVFGVMNGYTALVVKPSMLFSASSEDSVSKSILRSPRDGGYDGLLKTPSRALSCRLSELGETHCQCFERQRRPRFTL